MGFDLAGGLILVNLGGVQCGNHIWLRFRFESAHHCGLLPPRAPAKCCFAPRRARTSPNRAFSSLFGLISPFSPQVPAVPCTTCSVGHSGIFCSPCSGKLRFNFFAKNLVPSIREQKKNLLGSQINWRGNGDFAEQNSVKINCR